MDHVADVGNMVHEGGSMREIKFRFYDNQDKVMRYFTLNEMLERHFAYYGSYDLKVLQSDKMHYIGVNDNTGKEIYKGDIVELPRCNNTIAVVEEFGVGYILREVDGSGFIRFADEPNPLNFKVIGNIYENPELIK